ncbi:MAG: hypothetical protein IJ608_09530 [Lachnospiraceae bacterium]|nr:hypothetical protein [Lachnospiraceae bacterium]
MDKTETKRRFNITAVLLLVLYPLRHIAYGIDLWDTGYNYANFEYMGMEHMDPMWLFSTYIGNLLGFFFTKLPFGKSLIGLNFYTALIVSLISVTGFFFYKNVLKIKTWIILIGEFVAISLCWCPTALLYNYLTYLLLMLCIIEIYIGLTKDRYISLFIAGVFLGLNIFVRLSNLPQAVFIAAVWAYGIVEYLEIKEKRRALITTAKRTLFCFLGYISAVLIMLVYMQMLYGLPEYFEGIMRTFHMGDNAADYTPYSMLMGIIAPYRENMYWAVRIFIILVVFTLFIYVAGIMCEGRLPRTILRKLNIAGAMLVAVLMLIWLYYRGFCAVEFTNYGAIYRPGVLFLMLSALVCVLNIFRRGNTRGDRLMAGLLLILIFITSIGSNNSIYPSLNNLFLIAPYTLSKCFEFLTVGSFMDIRLLKSSTDILDNLALPAKTMLAGFLIMCFMQSALFGVFFVFGEATGLKNMDSCTENVPALKNIRMSAERAERMDGLYKELESLRLLGKNSITFGNLPALSFYLQLPAAFNPWCDLRSYSYTAFEADMNELGGRLSEKGYEAPVIIIENRYTEYERKVPSVYDRKDIIEKAEPLKAVGDERVTETLGHNITPDMLKKYEYLREKMTEWGYEPVSVSDWCTVYYVGRLH